MLKENESNSRFQCKAETETLHKLNYSPYPAWRECSCSGWDMIAGQSHSVLSPFTNWLNVRLSAGDAYHEAATYLTSDSPSGWHRLGFRCLTTSEDWRGDFRQTPWQEARFGKQFCVCIRAPSHVCIVSVCVLWVVMCQLPLGVIDTAQFFVSFVNYTWKHFSKL